MYVVNAKLNIKFVWRHLFPTSCSNLGGSEANFVRRFFSSSPFLKYVSLKNGENFAPKWTSKKAFLKTPREHFHVFLGRSSPSSQVLWQWSFFLMTRAFEWWLLECHTTCQKFSAAWNPKFCDLDKKSRGDIKIQLIWKEWLLHQAEVINVLKIEMFRWFIDLLSP